MRASVRSNVLLGILFGDQFLRKLLISLPKAFAHIAERKTLKGGLAEIGPQYSLVPRGFSMSDVIAEEDLKGS